MVLLHLVVAGRGFVSSVVAGRGVIGPDVAGRGITGHVLLVVVLLVKVL